MEQRTRIEYAPKLITPDDAAHLLGVSRSTVQNWIKRGTIPYIELPTGTLIRRTYRIPLDGLLSSLSGNFDLDAAFSRVPGTDESHHEGTDVVRQPKEDPSADGAPEVPTVDALTQTAIESSNRQP